MHIRRFLFVSGVALVVVVALVAAASASSPVGYRGAVPVSLDPPIDGGGWVDVPSGHWAGGVAGPTWWAAASGIVKGCNPPTNDRFCPDEPMTRAEVAALFQRYDALLADVVGGGGGGGALNAEVMQVAESAASTADHAVAHAYQTGEVAKKALSEAKTAAEMAEASTASVELLQAQIDFLGGVVAELENRLLEVRALASEAAALENRILALESGGFSTIRVFEDVIARNGNIARGTIYCPDGMVALSGGLVASTPTANAALTRSRPMRAPNGLPVSWELEVTYGGAAGDGFVGYVVCGGGA